MTRRRFVPIAVAALLAVAVVAWPLACRSRRPDLHLVVADLRQPATSLVFVAEGLGCFRREGVRISERTFELGRDALTAVLDGSADVAVAFETPVLRRFLEDDRVRVLSALHSSTRNTRVIGRRDRGVVEGADLRGKRIGVARGTNAQFFLQTLLTFAGIAPSEVAVVELDPKAAVTALREGTVDAVALWDPYADDARAGVGEAATEIRTALYAEYSLLATRADVVASRRPALEALLRGLACGERRLQERPDEAFHAIRARFPDRSDVEVRLALARVSPRLSLDGSLVAVLRREADWLWSRTHANGEVPDLSRLIEPSLLEAVEPEAVNIPVRP